jgi:hypothetical protein
VPATWEEFESAFLDSSENIPVSLGLGSRYITQSPSIASLFFVQNEIESIDRIGESMAKEGLEDYLKYAKSSGDSTGISSLKSTMDQENRTATDLFVEGKMSVIFGYPSLLREIEYSIKRA